MNTNLFFNYYSDPKRQHEIDRCLDNNKRVFDNVFILNGRPTFNEIFEHMRVFPNDINCFCNSDIYFESVEDLYKIRENECWALTRYNLIKGSKVFFDRVDSQDAWVFNGAPKKINAPFTAGLWGCDNRLLYELFKVGYMVRNPSLTVKTIHLHENDNRNHRRTDENTVKPPYKTIKPCLI